jgi:putative spermidine/putrescine transport system ATP-binding protein
VTQSLVLDEVGARYGATKVLDQLSLSVAAGELVSLLGASGCGKTTTLRLVAGFVEPSSGEIRLGERDLTKLPPHRRDIGLVFQNYALFPHLSVADNVAFGLKQRGISRTERRRSALAMLGRVGLAHLSERLPGALSGGQKQRVALARALVIEPQLLMFDEPLSNLDFKLRLQMRDELKGLQRRLGKTAIYVTHDQTEALMLSDRIAVLSQGQIEQIGTPNEIYERPASSFVADFIGNSNLLPVTIVERSDHETVVETARGLRLRCVSDNHAGHAGAEVAALIRPECIQIRSAGAGATAGQNCFSARIVAVAYLGEDLRVDVDLAGGQLLQTTLKNAGTARDWTPLQPVDILVDPADVRLLRR